MYVKVRKGALHGLMRRPEGKSHLEDPGVDGRIILRLMFRKWVRGYRLDWSGWA
jgi:hypothetical protein